MRPNCLYTVCTEYFDLNRKQEMTQKLPSTKNPHRMSVIMTRNGSKIHTWKERALSTFFTHLLAPEIVSRSRSDSHFATLDLHTIPLFLCRQCYFPMRRYIPLFIPRKKTWKRLKCITGILTQMNCNTVSYMDKGIFRAN